MKKELFYSIGLFLILTQPICAQKMDSTGNDSQWRTRNIIWFAPVYKNTIINGWAISTMASPDARNARLQINGLNTEIGIGFLLWPYIMASDSGRDLVIFSEKDSADYETIINGVTLSITGHCTDGKVSGVSLNGISAAHRQCNGLMAALAACGVWKMNGVMVSGIKNRAESVKGLQIALFNSCKNLKGIQIGLINKNQKRTLPIINWCFKD